MNQLKWPNNNEHAYPHNISCCETFTEATEPLLDDKTIKHDRLVLPSKLLEHPVTNPAYLTWV